MLDGKVEDKLKKCSKCGESKALVEFYRDGDRLRASCKACKDKCDKEYRRIKNIENPGWSASQKKAWEIKNPDKVMASRLKTYKRNKTPERRAVRAKEAAKWRSENPEKIKEMRRKQRNRPEVKLADNLRRRLKYALVNGQKAGSAVRDLGCTIEELIQYLEKQFYPNPKTGEQMTWENHVFYGWHIDHIMPLASFDLMDREQLLKACHYTNLQPLWAEENLRKGDKIIK